MSAIEIRIAKKMWTIKKKKKNLRAPLNVNGVHANLHVHRLHTHHTAHSISISGIALFVCLCASSLLLFFKCDVDCRRISWCYSAWNEEFACTSVRQQQSNRTPGRKNIEQNKHVFKCNQFISHAILSAIDIFVMYREPGVSKHLMRSTTAFHWSSIECDACIISLHSSDTRSSL